MSKFNSEAIIVESEDLETKNLQIMQGVGVIGVMAIVTLIVMSVLSLEQSWLYLAAMIIAALACIVMLGSSLGNIISGDDEKRDEWQKNLLKEARANSFLSFQVGFITVWLILFIVHFLDFNVEITGKELRWIVLGFAMLCFILPRCIMAFLVTPLPTDGDEG